MKIKALSAALLGALALSACNPPKYVSYTSIHGDWKAQAPWGWRVMTDQEGKRFTNANFIGPFEPEFYLGAPSFGVRWHSYSFPHRLADGRIEMYSSINDFIRQTLAGVYAPDYELVDPAEKAGEWKLPVIDQPKEIVVDGRRARSFTVLAPVRVPRGARWGVLTDSKTKETGVVRLHAYVVVPAKRGFYVLVYPATRDGFKFYARQFYNFVNTFTLLTEGPAGAP